MEEEDEGIFGWFEDALDWWTELKDNLFCVFKTAYCWYEETMAEGIAGVTNYLLAAFPSVTDLLASIEWQTIGNYISLLKPWFPIDMAIQAITLYWTIRGYFGALNIVKKFI